MRKRLIIDLDVNYVDEKAVVNKIAYAAMKVLRANRGSLVGIRQEELPGDPVQFVCVIPDGDDE